MVTFGRVTDEILFAKGPNEVVSAVTSFGQSEEAPTQKVPSEAFRSQLRLENKTRRVVTVTPLILYRFSQIFIDRVAGAIILSLIHI